MMDPKHIRPDVMIELRDEENSSWIPLTIVSVTGKNVECRTLAYEPILTTVADLVRDARLRPRGARQQQRHAPVADVGVIEGGLERLVFDEQTLGRRERRVTGLQPLDEPRAPLPDVGGAGIVGPVREPE